VRSGGDANRGTWGDSTHFGDVAEVAGGPRQLRRAVVDVQCVLRLSLKIIV
jgi:hypothetical protein